jgi:hypothetical protein
MTYARKVDANQAQIVAAFRCLGWLVHDMSGTGGGFPDLMIGKLGPDGKVRPETLRLVEVKDGKKPPSARELTPPQVKFHSVWPVVRVMSVDDVIALCAKGS